ncbi:hypothetical protein EDD85DRAFT_982669 [Armillaria nabsnona]|nr:hypothetical protein EDD85DRAFT_982669 [Armillaria nabsnona]
MAMRNPLVNNSAPRRWYGGSERFQEYGASFVGAEQQPDYNLSFCPFNYYLFAYQTIRLHRLIIDMASRYHMEGPNTRSKAKQKDTPEIFTVETKLAPAGSTKKFEESSGTNKATMAVLQRLTQLPSQVKVDPIHRGNAGNLRDDGRNKEQSRATLHSSEEAHDSDRFLKMRAEKRDLLRLQEGLVHENKSLLEQNQVLERRLQHDVFQRPKRKDAPPESKGLKQEGSYSLLPLTLKADSYSWAEVEAMVALLNREIRDLASFLVDELSAAFASTCPHSLVVETSPTINTLYERLGRRFTQFLLGSADPDQRRLVVRMALRSVLVTGCKAFVQYWSADTAEHNVLTTLYGNVLNRYPAMAGHWRSMAKESIRGRPKPDLTACFHRRLVDEIVMVLHAAGWQNYNAKETIQERFADHIEELVKLVTQVRDAIGSDIVSRDLRLFSSQPDTPFDSTAMIDDDRRGQENFTALRDVVNRVAACTGIGLIVDRATGEVRNDGDDVDGTRQKGRILVKAQVMGPREFCVCHLRACVQLRSAVFA